MPKYVNSDGDVVSAEELSRQVWCSASGICGYWTDDWDKLNTHGKHGIPCCPHCGCVGMQSSAKSWFEGAVEFEKQNPRYMEFLDVVKETCAKVSQGPSFLTRYKLWAEKNPPLE